MTLKILEEAEREFADYVAYYELKETGLGVRFRNEVAGVVDWIQENFNQPRLRAPGYQRVNLRVFPHYVAYVIRSDTIWVVSISHAFRKPEHWIKRI